MKYAHVPFDSFMDSLPSSDLPPVSQKTPLANNHLRPFRSHRNIKKQNITYDDDDDDDDDGAGDNDDAIVDRDGGGDDNDSEAEREKRLKELQEQVRIFPHNVVFLNYY